ncbi:MAG: sugar phosphate isomerase/epimerase family protein [Phycisphaerae bacterium]
MLRIGLVTRWGNYPAEFFARHRFQSAELVIWPDDDLSPLRHGLGPLRQVQGELAAHQVVISALAHYDNHLDPSRQPALREHFTALLDGAGKLGIPIVAGFTGRDPERSIEDNIPAYREYWTPLARRAEDAGVRIAFENCPKFRTHPFRGGNIAFTPKAWDLMFDALPSRAVGIEWDAAHLVCMLIDPIATIRRYGDRIYHVHAKDAEVRWEIVREHGIFDERACRHRMVGLGQTHWADAISALLEAGYDGDLNIEGRHDPIYRDEREVAGLLVARDTLLRYLPVS